MRFIKDNIGSHCFCAQHTGTKWRQTGVVLAAPSWVFPGGIAENCNFLSGKVDEVGLLFMESASAMAYTSADLPAALAALPVAWHVHLPSDLDWADPAGAAKLCVKLMDKVKFLGAERAVLHPPLKGTEAPGGIIALLENFVLRWKRSGRNSRDILLENLPDSDPAELMAAAERLGVSLCLDLAHLLLSADEIPKGYMEHVRLLHLCAPAPGGGKGHHCPLTDLSDAAMTLGAKICRAAKPETVFMLEIFNWRDFVKSLPVLNAWME